jgi:ethanolaminephosphotransferase
MANNHLVLFCLTMSFVFGRMTTKIILAHLTRQPVPYWTVMLWPLIGGAIIGNLPYLGLPAVAPEVELWYLIGYFVFAVVAYFRWAFLVTNSICSYLGINCLTIPYAKQEQLKQEMRNANGHAAKPNGAITNGKVTSSNGTAGVPNGKARHSNGHAKTPNGKARVPNGKVNGRKVK